MTNPTTSIATTPDSTVPLLDLRREYLAHRQEFLDACERVLDSMRLLGGPEGQAFEAEMTAFLGAKHVRGVASGTDALRLALRAVGVSEGDEVLLQANAFMAAVEAIADAGARPVPIDVRESDLGPDLEQMAARITPRTRAILIVHLYGLPIDLPPVVELARSSDLPLVEDGSHAHGATYDGRSVGTFGRVGAFSLGVVKNLAAYGDAGMITTDDEELVQRVRWLGTHGQVKKNEHAFYGGNSRLDELHAAMLRVKLRHLHARNERRARIASHYTERLSDLVVTPPADPRRVAVYHQYVVRTPKRDELRAFLTAEGIETGIHYPTPIHRQPAWRTRYDDVPALPHAERTAREILSLPVFPDLTDAEVERVADGVARFFR
jgi:dTDP-4-amino-4,6-dideoxygalactose transaminase